MIQAYLKFRDPVEHSTQHIPIAIQALPNRGDSIIFEDHKDTYRDAVNYVEHCISVQHPHTIEIEIHPVEKV